MATARAAPTVGLAVLNSALIGCRRCRTSAAAAPRVTAGTTQASGSSVNATASAASDQKKSIRWLPIRALSHGTEAARSSPTHSADCHHGGRGWSGSSRSDATTLTPARKHRAATNTTTGRGMPDRAVVLSSLATSAPDYSQESDRNCWGASGERDAPCCPPVGGSVGAQPQPVVSRMAAAPSGVCGGSGPRVGSAPAGGVAHGDHSLRCGGSGGPGCGSAQPQPVVSADTGVTPSREWVVWRRAPAGAPPRTVANSVGMHPFGGTAPSGATAS